MMGIRHWRHTAPSTKCDVLSSSKHSTVMLIHRIECMEAGLISRCLSNHELKRIAQDELLQASLSFYFVAIKD